MGIKFDDHIQPTGPKPRRKNFIANFLAQRNITNPNHAEPVSFLIMFIIIVIAIVMISRQTSNPNVSNEYYYNPLTDKDTL